MTSLDQHRLFRARSTDSAKYEELTSNSGYLRSEKILFRLEQLLETLEAHFEHIKRFDDPQAVCARQAHNPRAYLSEDLMKVQIELNRLKLPGRILRPDFIESLEEYKNKFVTSFEKALKELKLPLSTKGQIYAIFKSLNSLTFSTTREFKSIIQHPRIQQLAANLRQVKELHQSGDFQGSIGRLSELDELSASLASRSHHANKTSKKILGQRLQETEPLFQQLIQIQGIDKVIEKIWSNLRSAVGWSKNLSAVKHADHSKPQLNILSEDQIRAAKPVRLLDKRVSKHVRHKTVGSIAYALDKFVDFFTKIPKRFLTLAFQNLDAAEEKFITNNTRSEKSAVYNVLRKFDEAEARLMAA